MTPNPSVRRALGLALAGLVLFVPIAAAAECSVTPESLRGAWEHTSGAGFFQQMEFTSDEGRAVFNSWLHERPEVIGATWSLEKCTLRISSLTDRSLSFVYAASMKGSQRLELRESGRPVAKYRRVKE
jgi:hypothetical protein